MHRNYLPIITGSVYRACFAVGCLLISFNAVTAQTSSLIEEEEGFYNNFALSNYEKEVVEERLDEYYDLFGEYITNGFYVYSLENSRYKVSNTRIDSTTGATSNELRDELFFDNFTNYIYTQDAIGGVKTAFIIGDQIRTRFAPLTFSKRNYEGIRWDLWYAGLGITSLISRTRPGLMARRFDSSTGYGESDKITGSYVTYPMLGVAYDQTGEDWNQAKTSSVDWTARTAFGDYDFLWGLYVKKKFADKFDVGISYVNHHRSDIQKGEKWHGDLPNALAPDELHLEFYDLTYNIETDPGVILNNVTMTVYIENKEPVRVQPASFYVADSVFIFNEKLGETYPRRKDGEEPLIATFYPKVTAGRDSLSITKITFDINIQGNYIVFLSSDKIGPLDGVYWSDLQARYALHMQVRDLITHPGIDTFEINDPGESSRKSEIFHGEYILKSPVITTSDNGNRVNYTHTYTLETARIVYGIDFKGNIYNTDIKGEIALNNRRGKYPGKGAEVQSRYNLAAYISFERALADKMRLSGSVFNMDADYQPYLSNFQISRYLSVGRVPSGISSRSLESIWPVGISNDYTTIDDNEDDDFYVENNRSYYPSEAPSSSSKGFYHEGTRKSPRTVALPSAHRAYSLVYDDQDGVIPDRYDRNKNGILDYEEDFLLYNADPPLFDLEPDHNNNNIPDGQEDDIYPDYPIKPHYTLTSNGYRSLGIQGLDLEFNYTPKPNIIVDAGFDFRRALDPNMDGEAEGVSSREGKSLTLYGRGMYRLTRRDLGISVFLGQELKFAQDGIRDDVVEQAGGYYLNTDMLRFRNAFVSNSAASINYLNIPNFEITGRLALKAEQHFADEGEMFLTRISINRDIGYGGWQTNLFDYKDATILGGNAIAKLAYTFTFNQLPPYLAFLKDLKITPQYKLMYNYSKGNVSDPREDPNYTDLLKYTSTDSIWIAAVKDWVLYDNYNDHDILSVPILRAKYPLGDKTYLDFGWQWKRKYDMLVHARNVLKESRVLQIISQDNYLSFNVAFQIGLLWEHSDYDINYFHRAYTYGTFNDYFNSYIFCRLYAGL